MKRGTKLRILRFCGPLCLVLGFIANTIYNVGFAWWLDPWLETKSQQALLKDVRAHLGFLFDEYGADLVSAEERGTTPYTAVTVHVLSLRLRLSDMRGDLHVEVAPDKLPDRFEELSSVLAWWAIKDGDKTSNRSYGTWDEVGSVLRLELHRINNRLADER